MDASLLVQDARLQRHIRNLLTGLFLIALAVFFDFAREFILPVVLASFIAMTFRPAIRNLARRHIPEWLTASGFITVVVIAVLCMLYLIAEPFASFVRDAPGYAQTFSHKLRGVQGSVQAFLNFAETIQDATKPDGVAQAQEVIVRDGPPFAYIGQITGYSLSVIATIVVTLVMAAFLMASGDLFYAKLVRVLPTLKDKKTALRIVYDVENEVSSYLIIVSAINAGLGVAVGLTFFFLGMDSPVLWGAVAFVLNFIPYVGAVIGIGLAAFMAVVSFDSLSYAVLVPLSYAFWNGFENQLVSPYFLSRRLQLNSLSILLALAFWTWIWGIAGTVVAVPLLVTIKVFCDHLDSLKGIGEFLSQRYPEDQVSVAEPAILSVVVAKK
jgi:predicted PurR-regulated permease PerM